MTTLKEILTLITSRYRGALYFKVREELRKQLKQKPKNIQVLDVGGRNSPYTCCMPGQYTISDLKRESSSQMQLKLGFTDNIIENLKHNRSNLTHIAGLAYKSQGKSVNNPIFINNL